MQSLYSTAQADWATIDNVFTKDVIKKNKHTEWITKGGKTTLIQKDPKKWSPDSTINNMFTKDAKKTSIPEWIRKKEKN